MALTLALFADVLASLACAASVDVYVAGMSGAYNAWQRSAGQGVITQPVGDRCNVHLVVTGLFDADKERAKLQKKIAGVHAALVRLRDVMTKPDYATKVPQDVQDANAFKVRMIWVIRMILLQLQALETEHAEFTSALHAISGVAAK